MKTFVLFILVFALAWVLPKHQNPPADQAAAVQGFLNQAWQFCATHPTPSDKEIDGFLVTVMAPKHGSHDPKEWPRQLIHRLATRKATGYYLTLPNGTPPDDPKGGSFGLDEPSHSDSRSGRAIVWRLTFPSDPKSPPPPDDNQGPKLRLIAEEWRFILVQTPQGWQLEEASYNPTTQILKAS
ncbi:MAG TPA: hypothetical protein VLE93_03490 [Candidatus Saccharimonadales bacterium]|nr:hypothetical protein [Candidatus Saccharimonadales bacterium]